MSVEFIYGPASCDHETPLVEKATKWLLQDKKNEVFYLVPNHIKFETEVSVLETLHKLPAYQERDNMTTMRLQVFSFTRLAWYYLQHTPYYNDKRLSEAGNHMVLRKILMEEEESLQVFRGEVNKPGFIGKLADLFDEFQEGNIGLDDLAELLEQSGDTAKEQDFRHKLLDFSLLYEKYIETLHQREIGNSELITHLATYLQGKEMGHIMVIVSGFSRFTAKERLLIETLLIEAGEVKISLVLDRGYVQAPPEKYELFYASGSVYHDLYQLARSKHIPVLQDTLLPTPASNDLVVLDNYWRESQTLSRKPTMTDELRGTIQVWEADTPYEEVRSIAKEIRRLVAEEGIRYKDIEVLTRELPQYDTMLAPVFNAHQIPYYMNRELEMKHHPLVEYITTLFAIHTHRFRYKDIMRFLRTELFLPLEENTTTVASWQRQRDVYRNKVDITENVVLAYGYEGYFWTQEKDWRYVLYDYEEDKALIDENIQAQQQSNEIRNDVRKLLVPFFQQLDEADNGKEAAQAIYQFLVNSGVEQTLIFWRNQDIEQGQLEEAKIHEQTWQAMMQLLDEYVEILGDAPFVLADFVEIFTAGMEGLTYSKVPTTIDQVAVSSLDLIHATKNKVTFIMGATDSVLPTKIENKTLLSDEERGAVDDSLPEEKYLVKNTSAELAKEPFVAYLAFLSATDRLYLSYPRTSEQSKDVKMSPYVARIAKELRIPVEIKTSQQRSDIFALSQMGTYRSLLSDLTTVKQVADETKESIHPVWLFLEKTLMKQADYQELARHVFGSLTYKNIPETLETQTIEELYGSTIHASVSKIESFHLCQYQYFMNYGLQLKERDVFGLTPAATGDFFHDSLDTLFKVLIREKLTLSKLTDKELKELTESVLIEVLGANKFAILDASNRMNYIRYQLSKTIQKVSWALQKQAQRTGMSTLQTEVLFGQIMGEKGMDGLNISLPNNHDMRVRGKIDRLDGIEIDNQTFLTVVDYKSSHHRFDYRNVYYGIAMQMITYLDIAMTNAVALVGKKEVVPGGAFYLHVKNPLLDGGLDKEKEQNEVLKQFKYNGLLLENEELVEKLDLSLEPGNASPVYPVRLTAKEKYTSQQYVTETEMEELIQHNRRNFEKAGEQIYQGNVRLNPAYAQKQRLACGYCPFRSVCQFDVMLKENEYHRLEALKKEEVLERIAEQNGGEADGK